MCIGTSHPEPLESGIRIFWLTPELDFLQRFHLGACRRVSGYFLESEKSWVCHNCIYLRYLTSHDSPLAPTSNHALVIGSRPVLALCVICLRNLAVFQPITECDLCAWNHLHYMLILSIHGRNFYNVPDPTYRVYEGPED